MDWVPAISTTSLLAGALWLARNVIATRLTNSVRHEYDGKLANLNSELAKKQEILKADLRSKELQLESLRTTALTGIAQRQSALFEKQVQAIETIWSQIINLSPVKAAAQNLSFIKFDDAIKHASEDKKTRDVFEMLGKKVELTSVDTTDANKVRPFISPVAWAYFSAYTAILGHAAIKLYMLKKGLNYPEIINVDGLKKVIVTALPHQEQYVESVNESAYYHLLDELESLILLAFNNTLNGEQEDRSTLLKAAEIIRASESLTNNNKLEQHEDL